MPLHVILAGDPLLIDETAADLTPDGASLQRCYADEMAYDAVFGQLGSRGLFDDVQALHYVNFLAFKFNKREQEAFAELAARLPAETTVICSQLAEDLSKQKLAQIKARREFKQLSAIGKLHDLTALSGETKARAWLAARSKERYALLLSTGQAAVLLESCAGSLALCDAELRKLSLLKSDDKPQRIPDQLFDSILSEIPTAQFYRVADSIAAGAPGAIDELRHWFGIDGETFRLINELRRRLLGLLALERGEQVMPPFFERQLRQLAPRYRGNKLGMALELLAQLEFDLKSGAIPGPSSAEAELAALEVFTGELGALLSRPPARRA